MGCGAEDEKEYIRWNGAPQPYQLLDKAHKGGTFVSLAWALAWAIFLIGGYYALCITQSQEVKSGVMIICVVIPLVLAWGPLGDKNRVKKLEYAVTDRKIIVVSSGREDGCILFLSDLDAVRIEKAGNGNCHCRLGSSTFKASARKLPTLAVRGDFEVKDGKKVYTGLVFYNVSTDDGKAIRDLLKTSVTVEESNRP